MKNLHLLFSILFLTGTVSAQTEFDVIDAFTLEKITGDFTVSSTKKQAGFRYGEGYFTIENVTGPVELTVESAGMKPLTITVTVTKEKSRGYLLIEPDDATLEKHHSQYPFYASGAEKDTLNFSAPPEDQPAQTEEPAGEPEKSVVPPSGEPGSGKDAAPSPIAVADEEPIYVTVSEEASFHGGSAAMYKYIGTNLRYPEKAIEYNTQGKVYVRFVVKKNGEVGNIRIIKSVNLPLDQECVRILTNMPKWIPGKYNDKPVNSYFTLPVVFKLQ